MSADVSRQGRVVITTLYIEQVPTPQVFYLHGRALEIYKKAYGQKEYDYWIDYMGEKYSDLILLKDILEKEDFPVGHYPPFEHRGIHDVESLFWVMTWTLLLVQPVLPPNQLRQLHEPSHTFMVKNMLGYMCWQGGRASPESRDQPTSYKVWKQTLGDELGNFDQMMATLQRYFFFPWYRVLELDKQFAEQHGFELLRRQLLTAIVRCLPDKEPPFTPEDINDSSCIPLERGYCINWRTSRVLASNSHLKVPTPKGQSSSQNSNTGSPSSATKRARSESGVVVTRSRSKKKKTSAEEDSIVKQIIRFHKLRSEWLP
jgi:hypothetical protein